MRPGHQSAGAARGRSPRRWLLAAAGGLAAAWIAASLLGSSVARRMVIAGAEQRLDARLEVGALHYLPPFWVSARDVAVVGELDGERVEWLRLGSMRARIAMLPPFGELRLGRVMLDQPVVTVVRTSRGLRDALDLWRGGDAGDAARVPVGALRVADARIDLVDRTGADPARPTVSAAGFALALDAAGAPGSFAFTISGGDRRLATAGEGTLDLDAGTLAIARLDVRAALDGPGPASAGEAASASAELRGMRVAVDLGQRTARVDGGTLALGGASPLLLDDVRATLALGGAQLDASGLAVRVGGGEARGRFSVRWDEQPGWQASGEASGVDLAEVARHFPELGGGKVSGRLSGRGAFSGALTGDEPALLASLRGSGRMRVRAGEFYRLPVVAMLLEQARLSSEGATLREAAAAFRIADRAIHLDNAALGSPSIGVQGHGTMGFDGALQLDMIVVPLGDWRLHLERAGVPVIGDALAGLAGQVQSLLGKASAAIYEFHVSGTMQAPLLTPVPVPVLTRPAAKAFGRMASGVWEDVLGDGAPP